MSKIYVSTSCVDQARAAEVKAEVLSKYLNDLGCDHGYIGGFAWSLLGSERTTKISSKFTDLHDIDVLVETKKSRYQTCRIKY
jgi:hypothetical protein